MRQFKIPLRIWIPAAAVFLCAIGLISLRPWESKEPLLLSQEEAPDTFTFYGVGPDTAYSVPLKNELDKLLGNGSVETRVPIDLMLPGMDATRFPKLQGLNEKLNPTRLQRVEHDTLQLTYRYARKKNVPFDLIRLVFSGPTRAPLFFSLYTEKDGSEAVDFITRKYGPPATIDQGEGLAPIRYWERSNALFIISITQDRLGNNGYHFGIYYLDRISALAEAEEKAREEQVKAMEKAGGRAF